jgi:hypothetical protein
MMGWQLAAITVGAPAMEMSAIVTVTSHHGQWRWVSFRINDGEKQFPSQDV